MTSITCPNCFAVIRARRLADADGVCLLGCCDCGVATVEHSFPELRLVGAPKAHRAVTSVDWRDRPETAVVSFPGASA